MASRVGHCAKSRPKNNLSVFAIQRGFWYIARMMGATGQRQKQWLRLLKAKVALVLDRADGQVPKENEIDHAYQTLR